MRLPDLPDDIKHQLPSADIQSAKTNFAASYRIAKMLDAGHNAHRISRQTTLPMDYVVDTITSLRTRTGMTALQALILEFAQQQAPAANIPLPTPPDVVTAQALQTQNAREIVRSIHLLTQAGYLKPTQPRELRYSEQQPDTLERPPAPKQKQQGLRDIKREHELILPEGWPGTKPRIIATLWPKMLAEFHDEQYDEANATDEENDRVTALYQVCETQTKRIIIDTQQFAVFSQAADNPIPENAFQDLHWPFDTSIYVELSEPRYYQDDERSIQLEGFIVLGEGEVRTVAFAMFVDDTFTLRAINMDIRNAQNAPAPGEQPPAAPNNLAKVICMTMSYMTARGIRIVEEPLKRNVRRHLKRKHLANPYHIITTDATSPRYPQSAEPATGSSHSIRYDVIGHIRFGRHLLSDGTHRVTREWVRPHQRGLRNLRYVPATRKFNAAVPSEEQHND